MGMLELFMAAEAADPDFDCATIWHQQTCKYMRSLELVLDALHSTHGFKVTRQSVASLLPPYETYRLAFLSDEAYPGLAATGVLSGLQDYLRSLPHFARDEPNIFIHGNWADAFHPHGYITMRIDRWLRGPACPVPGEAPEAA